jgi:hypothetical protein
MLRVTIGFTIKELALGVIGVRIKVSIGEDPRNRVCILKI